MAGKLCIEIEILANGYEVSIPDVPAMDKAEAEAKKSKSGASPSVYPGDFMKSYAAKSVKEVLALVTPALKSMPQSTYDEAFAEASAENDDS